MVNYSNVMSLRDLWPDLKIPYAATAFVAKRSVIAKRQAILDEVAQSDARANKFKPQKWPTLNEATLPAGLG